MNLENINWKYYFNTDLYSIPQLILCCIGGVLWVMVYIRMIVNIKKTKYVEMPAFIAIGNIVWEALWSWVFSDLIDIGYVFVLFYRIWFLLDCLIFYHVFKSGEDQIHNPYLKKHYKLMIIGLVVFWTALIYSFVISGYDHPLGVNSAYILNVGIAILYPLLYMRQHQSGTFSKSIAWYKMLGSGIYTIALWNIISQDSHFEHFAGPIVFVIDCAYIWLIYNWKQPQLDPPFDPKLKG